jgi:chemotaxis protein MotB
MGIHKAWFLLLGAVLTGCVSTNQYSILEQENQALRQQARRDNDNAEDQADKNVDLALKNHRLKITNEDLKRRALDRESFYDSVTNDLRREVSDGKLKITRYKDMLTLDVADEILFESAKAGLKPEGKAVLARVGKSIARGERTIRVVGHTDNQPLAKGAAFETNWELSTARATTVVRFFQEEAGLDPRRLLAAGRGEWMPVATNSTPEGRQRNRRITITLVDANLLDGIEMSQQPEL